MSAADRYLGGCRRAVHVLGLPDDHCDSCHDDEGAGYDLLELDTRAGWYSVCCFVVAADNDRRKSRSAPAPIEDEATG